MKKFLIKLVKIYQKYISPLKKPTCIFTPTCSQYTVEALEKYGASKGMWMSIKRILKCHPYYKGPLYDPVDKDNQEE